jgi:hypothetical protein
MKLNVVGGWEAGVEERSDRMIAIAACSTVTTHLYTPTSRRSSGVNEYISDDCATVNSPTAPDLWHAINPHAWFMCELEILLHWPHHHSPLHDTTRHWCRITDGGACCAQPRSSDFHLSITQTLHPNNSNLTARRIHCTALAATQHHQTIA